MDREPGEDTNVFAVRRTLESQESQGLVDAVIAVLRPFRLRVSEIGIQAAVNIGIFHSCCAEVESSLGSESVSR